MTTRTESEDDAWSTLVCDDKVREAKTDLYGGSCTGVGETLDGLRTSREVEVESVMEDSRRRRLRDGVR